MQQERIRLLAEKFLRGSATEAEKEELHAWYDAWKDDEQMVLTALPESEAALKDRIRSTILRQISQEAVPAPVVGLRPARRKWWAIAAAVVLLAGLSGLLLQTLRTKPDQAQQAETDNYKNDVLPGKATATLQLADGRTINLADTLQQGLQQGDASLRKTNNSTLVYDTGTDGQPATREVTYNKITTPNGGEFNLVLADGSKVWLNAASSIRFPASFTGTARNVEITGEAYFEVAKDAARPFTVTANGTTTRVLGTHFNIKAYGDEGEVITTLLEGAVQVEAGSQQKKLLPGQQAQVLVQGQKIRVTSVEVDDAVAWKNGYFTFRNEQIKSMMRRIARWYDITVVYEPGVEAMAFGGTFSRSKSLQQLLKNLESTNTIHFKIEGNQVTVLP